MAVQGPFKVEFGNVFPELSVVEQRYHVGDGSGGGRGVPVVEVAERHGVSRKTVHAC
jgi:hypothetical protein